MAVLFSSFSLGPKVANHYCTVVLKNILNKKNQEIYCLITGGIILAGYHQGLLKTDSYAYQSVLSHKKGKNIDTLIG
jgi:hypothetical protein